MKSVRLEPGFGKSQMLTIRFGDSQLEALTEIAAEDGSVTHVGLVRAAVSEYLERHYGRRTGAA
jgi:hypothetical protein